MRGVQAAHDALTALDLRLQAEVSVADQLVLVIVQPDTILQHHQGFSQRSQVGKSLRDLLAVRAAHMNEMATLNAAQSQLCS